MSIITAVDLAAYMGDTANSLSPESLSFAASAANEAIADYCGAPKRIFTKTETGDASERAYRPSDQCRLSVHDFWDTSALQIAVDFADSGAYATEWTYNTHFMLEPTNAAADGLPYTTIIPLNTYFPVYNRRPSVLVTAAWGWETIPAKVTEAALIKAARLFKRKDSPEGVVGGFADFTAVRISSREDPDVMSLLQPARRNETAVRMA